MRASAPAARRATAVESFKTAADCIGKVHPGMALFAVTRGQFSMVDAVRHVLDEVGSARLSLWTWTVADYEVKIFCELLHDGRLESGRLVIDQRARAKNAQLLQEWRSAFGAESIRYCMNHAKIATVEGGGLRVLLRGSMNLNFNPRFEQLDVTEGGPDFDLVRQIEDALPLLPDGCSAGQAFAATRAGEAFDRETLAMFGGVKVWQK